MRTAFHKQLLGDIETGWNWFQLNVHNMPHLSEMFRLKAVKLNLLFGCSFAPTLSCHAVNVKTLKLPFLSHLSLYTITYFGPKREDNTRRICEFLAIIFAIPFSSILFKMSHHLFFTESFRLEDLGTRNVVAFSCCVPTAP